MRRLVLRRPSPATLIALLALFVAVGGPAEAAKLLDGGKLKPRSVSGKAIKQRTIGLDRLRPDAARALQLTPFNEVVSSKVLDKSLTGGDLADDTIGALQIAPSAIGASELATRSVDFDEIVDGGLGARDVGSFGGTVELDFGQIELARCAALTRDVVELGPREGVSPTVYDDVVVVTPPSSYPTGLLVRATPQAVRALDFEACNLTGGLVDPPKATFHYLTFDF